MRTHPGRMASEITIDAPYPRDESYRTSSDYSAYCRETSIELGRVTAGEEEG